MKQALCRQVPSRDSRCILSFAEPRRVHDVHMKSKDKRPDVAFPSTEAVQVEAIGSTLRQGRNRMDMVLHFVGLTT